MSYTATTSCGGRGLHAMAPGLTSVGSVDRPPQWQSGNSQNMSHQPLVSQVSKSPPSPWDPNALRRERKRARSACVRAKLGPKRKICGCERGHFGTPGIIPSYGLRTPIYCILEKKKTVYFDSTFFCPKTSKPSSAPKHPNPLCRGLNQGLNSAMCVSYVRGTAPAQRFK